MHIKIKLVSPRWSPWQVLWGRIISTKILNRGIAACFCTLLINILVNHIERAKAKIISGLILHAISLTTPKNDKSLQDDKRKRLMGIWEAWALHFLSICRQFRVKCLCCIVCDFKRMNQFQMQFYFSLFLNLPNLCWLIKTFKLFSKPN